MWRAVREPGSDPRARKVNPITVVILSLDYILFNMWTIVEHRRVDRQVDTLPRKALTRYETWKDIVSLSGPEGVRHIEGFVDESAPEKKKGRRQSRFSAGCLVVYRVRKREIRVRAILVK